MSYSRWMVSGACAVFMLCIASTVYRQYISVEINVSQVTRLNDKRCSKRYRSRSARLMLVYQWTSEDSNYYCNFGRAPGASICSSIPRGSPAQKNHQQIAMDKRSSLCMRRLVYRLHRCTIRLRRKQRHPVSDIIPWYVL